MNLISQALAKDLNLDKALGIFRVLDDQGIPDESLEPKLSKDFLLKIYEYMVRTRILDEWLLKLQRMGKVAIHAPNKGQEATMIGAALALREQDWMFPSYRELGALLVRGMSEEEIIDRAMANADDPLKGSDFAIYGSRDKKIVPAPVPVGNQIPHAVGFALAAKIMGDNIVVLTFFGDGATSRGDFHFGLNFAGLFKPPVVFVIQNNQWAISLPVRKQTAAPTLAVKGVAYGVPSIRVDGNDVLAVYSIAKEAVDKASSGEGPTLIESLTYRLGPHTTADDPKRYRSDEEVKRYEAKDPIPRFRRYLMYRGILNEDLDREIWGRWRDYIETVVRRCLSKPELPEEVIFEDVYSEMPWNLREQLEEFRESLKIMKSLGLKVE